MQNKVVRESHGDETANALDVKAPDRLTGLHIANFLDVRVLRFLRSAAQS